MNEVSRVGKLPLGSKLMTPERPLDNMTVAVGTS